jgi:HD-GYP domain-containing protein (c-di-GMP phosphodiesterase class II)
VKLGEGYAGRAVLSRQPVFTKDVRPENDVGRKYIFDQEGFISFGVYPLIAKGEVKGVLEIFHRSMLTPDQEWFDYFEALAGQAAIAVHNAELFYNISRTNLELIAAYDDTIEGWSRALEMRDRETVGHSRRVTQMTIRLARELDYPEEDLTILRQGVLLHDIGKMGIPDSILLKPGPLNEEEWASMRRHPEYARDFLNSIPHLRTTAVVPYTHHERWNGSGYPQGLSGESIPLASRVFMVVDVWDALSHERPYKTAWPQADVLKYLSDNAGILFDPKVVSVFLELYRQGEFDAYGIYSEPIEIVR